jgi:mono/diheme cytochrome c family protein
MTQARLLVAARTLFLAVFCAFLTLSARAQGDGIPTDDATVAAGDAIFKANCAQCHAIGEVVVGPALKDIHKRQKLSWLIPWIKNSSKMVASGDAHAVEVYNQYAKQQMPSFALSDGEITSIIAWVKKESDKPVVAAAAPTPGADGATAAPAEKGAAEYLDVLLIALVVVLIVLVVTLLIIANILTSTLKGRSDLNEADIEQINQQTNWEKIYKSRVVRGLATLIFVVAIIDVSLDEALGIGIQTGYQPTQPIAFSHKLHAGEHQINCAYCHTSVYKGKSANIPSANICMNCHSQIKTESPQIQKIYKAIEQNKPIEWVRVHNLPDLAYFNHSQHTVAGGLECKQCHGPIEQMEVVYQYSPLTMGWCINCHREYPLKTKDNGYYTKLQELHDKSNKGAAFTVSSNGGTECSKCHY